MTGRWHFHQVADLTITLFRSTMSKAQSFKAKIRAKFPPAETKERLACASSTAVNGLQLILNLFKGPADAVGVPGLKGGVEGLLFVIDVIKV